MSEKVLTKAPAVLAEPSKMVWSYSRLSTFERCARLFWYLYIEKRPTPVTVPLKVGKILAQTMEWVLSYGYSTEDAIRFALYEYDGIPDSETFGSLYRMLENALYFVPKNDNIYTEYKLSISTAQGMIQGFIDILEDDLLNDQVFLNDFKSSWVASEAEDSIQLKVYGWLFKELRGTAFTGDMYGRLIYPRINKMTEFQFEEKDFMEARTWFITQTEAILSKPLEKEEWERTSDKSKCEHCAFAGLCASEFTGKFPNSGLFANKEEVVAAGEFILHMEALIKQLKKKLKEKVKKDGPIQIGNDHWYMDTSPSKPKVIDTKQWLSFIEESGLDVADYLLADPSKIDEILVADEEGKAEQLIEWSTPRKTLKFGQLPKKTSTEELKETKSDLA